MRREESTANPDKEVGHDDANANPGSGASGPGEAAYSRESQVSGDGGEAEIDLERKRAALEADPAADDPAALAANPENRGVTPVEEDPTDQAGG